MEMENKPMEQPMQPQAAVAKAIGPEQLQKFMQILQDYKTGKTTTENRIVAFLWHQGESDAHGGAEGNQYWR